MRVLAAILAVGDAEGHRPDLGSAEWRAAMEQRMGEAVNRGGGWWKNFLITRPGPR